MSQQKPLRESVHVLTAGLVASVLLYLAYRNYTSPSTESPGLHRSNAVRRSRRRWQRGHAPRELDHDPTTQAIQNLNGRIQAQEPYGQYENYSLFGDRMSQFSQDDGTLDLFPQNIGPIFRQLVTFRDFNDYEAQILSQHIESIFIQNFLIQEFPAGYIIGDDVESIVHVMRSHGIAEDVVRIVVNRFDAQKPLIPVDWNLSEDISFISLSMQQEQVGHVTATQQSNADVEEAHGTFTDRMNSEDNVTPQDAIHALGGQSSDHRSGNEWADNDEQESGGSQGMLDLLYHIAGEQAKREGMVHRSVRCNSCRILPIRGIRYHCANCFNFDLCESCEAQQVHNITHVFYKIRIPTPSRGQAHQVLPVWYPGDPFALPTSIPRQLSKQLKDDNQVDKTELDSYYEQFKCLAGHNLSRDLDPAQLGMAISRKNFDLYFTTTSEDRPPPQNLLYDRIFAFYDANNDDLITFDEFVKGMVSMQNKTRAARVERMFKGYDLDNDGYVDRRDFLRMFRAYYAWHKECGREMIKVQEALEDDIRDAVQGTQPISAAFGWNDFTPHASRSAQDKQVGPHGDLYIVDGPVGVLRNETAPKEDRADVIRNAEMYSQIHPFGHVDNQPNLHLDDPQFDVVPSERFDDVALDTVSLSDMALHVHQWPPSVPLSNEDIISALGAYVPWEEIMDPTDRARIIDAQAKRLNETAVQIGEEAVAERWRRRQFYLDEQEGLSKPPGFADPDSSEDEDSNKEIAVKQKKPDFEDGKEVSDGVNLHMGTLQTTMSSRRQSMRSRSSSKVRFDDSAIDTDYETRSNTSSRSVPVNERWGGYEFGEKERDIGKEILYQAVQYGFNEVLDPFFKVKEGEALEAIASKSLRQRWKPELDAYEKSRTMDSKSSGSTSPSSGSLIAVKKNAQIGEGVVGASEHTAREDPVIGTCRSFDTRHEDPMLPQHRPNDLYVQESVSGPDHLVSKEAITRVIEHPPTTSLLQVWLKHRNIDKEAEERDGYGKLSFREFKRRLLLVGLGVGFDESTDENNEDNVSWESHIDEDEQEVWNNTAGLGRLSFLSSWLEMGQF